MRINRRGDATILATLAVTAVILTGFGATQLRQRVRMRVNQQSKLAFSYMIAAESFAVNMRDAVNIRRDQWNNRIRLNGGANGPPPPGQACPNGYACGPVGDAPGGGCNVGPQTLACWPDPGLTVPANAPTGFRAGQCMPSMGNKVLCWWREASLRSIILDGVKLLAEAISPFSSAHAESMISDSVIAHPGVTKNLGTMNCDPGVGAVHNDCKHCASFGGERVGCAKIELCEPGDPNADPLSVGHLQERCGVQVVHFSTIRVRRLAAGNAGETGQAICDTNFTTPLGGRWRCAGVSRTGQLTSTNELRRNLCGTGITALNLGGAVNTGIVYCRLD
jgi:hypothetical protein